MTHPDILETATLEWANEKACRQSAQALAAARPDDAIITLQGDLGAGKTTFTRHLLQALGVSGRIKSPTYAVMENYDVGWPVAHFDFYRFQDPQEWEDAGFRDVFAAPGLKLCEWPQKAEGLMPWPDLLVHLRTAPPAPDQPCAGEPDERRQVRLQAYSAVGRRLLRALAGTHG